MKPKDYTAGRMRAAFLALIPTAITGLTAAWASATGSWQWLGVTYGADKIADLRVITATATCMQADSHWTLTSASCNPMGAGHYDYPANYNYPSVWARTFAALGLTLPSTESVAWFLIALFACAVFVVSFLSLRRTRSAVVLGTLCLALTSPPVWLVLERGNIDIVVFAVVGLACLAYVLRMEILAAVLLGVAATAKLFPAGAGMLLFRGTSKRPVWIFGAVAALGLATEASEIATIGQRTPQPTSSAFGAAILFQDAWTRFGLPLSNYAPRVFGALTFLVVAAVLLVLLRRQWAEHLRQSAIRLVSALHADRIAFALVTASGGSLITAYLMGTNFDYRLIFAIPLAAGLSRLTLLGKCFAAAIIIQLWLTYPMPISVQRASDFAWVFLAPAIGLLVIAAALPRQTHIPEA